VGSNLRVVRKDGKLAPARYKTFANCILDAKRLYLFVRDIRDCLGRITDLLIPPDDESTPGV
jgi:hypothetical protein